MFSPVSIIICAKNESQNLTERLPAILQQDYPEFEVIVVNDRSTDNTAKVLSKLSHKFSNLRIITVEDINSKAKGKKNALAKGIEHAVFTDLLLTDADCIPSSKQWIKHMVSARNNSHEIVLGYGPHEKKRRFFE